MKNSHFIMGKNAIREVLKACPENLVKVLTCKKKDLFLQELKEKNIPIEWVDKDFLYSMTHSESHQSFVAKVKRKSFELKTFLNTVSDSSLILILDSIFDPQNFGSILRVSECMGVDAVIYSKNRGTSLTPSAAKASSGASELIPLIEVSNLAETVRKLKKNDFSVITAEIKNEAQDIRKFSFPKKTALIMGSEGKGVQPLLSKIADNSVYIPMFGRIDSLNVMQAAVVFLAKYRLF